MTRIFRPTLENSSIQWNWITLIGPDAKDFLQRLTTVFVKTLPVGQGAPGCFLTPQGKIRAYFTLWNYRPNEYAFEFDAGLSGKWKVNLLSLIDQFTFGENISVADATAELDFRWIFPKDSDFIKMGIDSLKQYETVAIDDEIRICHHGVNDYGQVWLTAWGSPARLAQWMDQTFLQAPEPVQDLTFKEIEAWRISSLRPKMDSEITESSGPLELGLKDAIAENKGCYPGQEVIEKIAALGSPPKRLVKISGEGMAPQSGDPVFSLAESPTEVGQITSVSCAENGFVALGLLNKIHAKEGLSVRFSNESISKGVIVKVTSYV